MSTTASLVCVCVETFLFKQNFEWPSFSVFSPFFMLRKPGAVPVFIPFPPLKNRSPERTVYWQLLMGGILVNIKQHQARLNGSHWTRKLYIMQTSISRVKTAGMVQHYISFSIRKKNWSPNDFYKRKKDMLKKIICSFKKCSNNLVINNESEWCHYCKVTK